jgi:hypothetical protein
VVKPSTVITHRNGIVNENMYSVASGGNISGGNTNGETTSGENITGVVILTKITKMREYKMSFGRPAC